MKAAIYHGPEDVRVDDVPIPEIGEDEILVKMGACGICGTDVDKLYGKAVTAPVMGHEVSGEVSKVGEAVQGFEARNRVFVHHHVSDYTCTYCRHGKYVLCPLFSKTNIYPAGFAEYIRVSEPLIRYGGVLKIPDDIPYDEATLIEPVGCCIKGITTSRLQPGDTVLILGAGPIGCIHVSLLKTFGAGQVIATDLVDYRLEAAKKFGADIVLNPARDDVVEEVKAATDGRGADVVITAVGSPKVFQQGVQAARRGANVCMFGAPHIGEILTLDMGQVFINEISILPSYSTSEYYTNIALELMRSKRVKLRDLITHRFKLEETVEAIRLVAETKESLKVVVVQ